MLLQWFPGFEKKNLVLEKVYSFMAPTPRHFDDTSTKPAPIKGAKIRTRPLLQLFGPISFPWFDHLKSALLGIRGRQNFDDFSVHTAIPYFLLGCWNMSQCSPRVILYCNMRYYGTCAAFPPQLPWSEFRMPTGHINTATDIFLNMSPYCSVIHLVCHTDERLWRVSHTLFGSNLLCLRNCHQLCSWRLRFYSLQTGILWVQTFSLNKLCADGPAKCRCKHLISFGARFSPTSLGTYVERGGTAVRVVYVVWPAAGPQQCLICTVIVSFFSCKARWPLKFPNAPSRGHLVSPDSQDDIGDFMGTCWFWWDAWFTLLSALQC